MRRIRKPGAARPDRVVDRAERIAEGQRAPQPLKSRVGGRWRALNFTPVSTAQAGLNRWDGIRAKAPKPAPPAQQGGPEFQFKNDLEGRCPAKAGSDDGDRTHFRQINSLMLYQMSYIANPMPSFRPRHTGLAMPPAPVEPIEFQPLSDEPSGSGGRCLGAKFCFENRENSGASALHLSCAIFASYVFSVHQMPASVRCQRQIIVVVRPNFSWLRLLIACVMRSATMAITAIPIPAVIPTPKSPSPSPI